MSRWTNSQVANADVALARLIASHGEHIRDAAEQWEKPHIVGNLGPCASYVPLRHLSKLLICLAGVEGETLPRVVKGLRCQPGLNALFEPKRQFPKLPTCTSRARRKVPDDPPDPENGSPASAGTERGADHLKKSAKSSPRKTTLRPDKSQASKRAKLAVYSGQTWLGTIEVRQGGSDFAAFNTTDRFLGSFGTLKAAADAVDAAANGGGL